MGASKHYARRRDIRWANLLRAQLSAKRRRSGGSRRFSPGRMRFIMMIVTMPTLSRFRLFLLLKKRKSMTYYTSQWACHIIASNITARIDIEITSSPSL